MPSDLLISAAGVALSELLYLNYFSKELHGTLYLGLIRQPMIQGCFLIILNEDKFHCKQNIAGIG